MTEARSSPTDALRGHRPRAHPVGTAVQVLLVGFGVALTAGWGALVGIGSESGWMYGEKDNGGIFLCAVAALPYALHVYARPPRRSWVSGAALCLGISLVLPLSWVLGDLAKAGLHAPVPWGAAAWFLAAVQSLIGHTPDTDFIYDADLHLSNWLLGTAAGLSVGLLPWLRRACPDCGGRVGAHACGLLPGAGPERPASATAVGAELAEGSDNSYAHLPGWFQWSPPAPLEPIDTETWPPCADCGRAVPARVDRILGPDRSCVDAGTWTYVCPHCDHAHVGTPCWDDNTRAQQACHECETTLGDAFQCPSCAFPRGWMRVACPSCAARQPVGVPHWVVGCDVFTLECVRCETVFYSLCVC